MSYKEIDIDWLQEIIVPAIDALYQNPRDRDLLDRDVNERTVVASVYYNARDLLLAKQQSCPGIKNLRIDLEYNRNFRSSKDVFALCASCSEGCINSRWESEMTSYPDLIIHQRGSNVDNQVVIEFKKKGAGSREQRILDVAKLTYFTCQKPFPGHEKESYQFRLGYFIDLKVNGYEITEYRNARKKFVGVRYDR